MLSIKDRVAVDGRTMGETRTVNSDKTVFSTESRNGGGHGNSPWERRALSSRLRAYVTFTRKVHTINTYML